MHLCFQTISVDFSWISKNIMRQKRDFGKRDYGKRDYWKRDCGKRTMGKETIGKETMGKETMGQGRCLLCNVMVSTLNLQLFYVNEEKILNLILLFKA